MVSCIKVSWFHFSKFRVSKSKLAAKFVLQGSPLVAERSRSTRGDVPCLQQAGEARGVFQGFRITFVELASLGSGFNGCSKLSYSTYFRLPSPLFRTKKNKISPNLQTYSKTYYFCSSSLYNHLSRKAEGMDL